MTSDSEDEVAAAPTLETRYVQTEIQLHIEPFIIPDNRLNVGAEWEEWLDEFEEEIQLQKVTTADDKAICLRRYGGKAIRRLLKHLPDPPALPGPEDNYAKLKRKLNLHLVPKKNKQHARYLFNKENPHNQDRPPQPNTAKLREKAEDCDFGGTRDDHILDTSSKPFTMTS
jgi:hypothetical protein